jgi:hypothetical protein
MAYLPEHQREPHDRCWVMLGIIFAVVAVLYCLSFVMGWAY